MLLALLLACSDPPTCEGGGDPLLELGSGDDPFVAVGEGDTVDAGSTGLALAFRSSGLDTTQGITTVVRIAADGGATTDSIAALTYRCGADGLGLTEATAVLPPAAVDGSELRIQASATDQRGITAETEVTVVLAR